MARYLVNRKTVRSEGIAWPGEIIEIDEQSREASVLLQRGFLAPVPENYQGAQPGGQPETQQPPEPDQPPQPPEPDQPPAPKQTREELIKDLTKENREDLNKLAAESNVENPEGYPNKEALAEAIVDKAEAETS